MIIKEREALRSRLRGAGLAVTHQREAVYAELWSRRDHPTAEELYRSLKPRWPSLSLATVYKSLQTLRSVGLVSAVDTPGSEARFDAEQRSHHHALCERCGLIVDLFDESLDRLQPPLSARGFSVARHSVQFHGLCARCARPEPNKRRTQKK